MKKFHFVALVLCSAAFIQCSNPSASGDDGDTDGTETPGTETPGTETPETPPETPNPDAKNCALSGLSTSVGYWETAFASGTTDYALLEIPQSLAAGMTCTATAGAAGQTLEIKVNDGDFTAVSSGAASTALNPPLGDNTITIRVTSPDGTEPREYTVAVRVFKVDAAAIASGWIQHPITPSTGAPGGQLTVYGRVYQPGVSLVDGVPNGLHAQFAIGPNGTDPRVSDRWHYYDATYNDKFGYDFDFKYVLTIPGASGDLYKYAFRYSLDGVAWSYFDANASTTFDVSEMVMLTIN